MYTVEQIRNAVELDDEERGHISETFKRPNPDAYSGFDLPDVYGWDEMYDDGFIVVEGVPVDYEVVHTTGGMDEGSHASVVFKIGDQYFRKEGFYASHYGTDWDGDFVEVVPASVQVVKYVEKDLLD